MDELINILFSSVNIALSTLLILLFTYWLLTIISGLDFDLDFDIDVEIEIETDLEIDTASSLESGNISLDDFSNATIRNEDILPKRKKDLKFWQVFLIYFNFVGLPFMFTFTFWIFCWWSLTISSTYLTGSTNNNVGFILFFLAIIPSLIMTKIGTNPFKNFFKHLNRKGVKPMQLVGRRGYISSNISKNKLGLVKLTLDHSPITIYAKSFNGEAINSGEQVLIIKESSDKKYYYIQSYKTI
ncbi:MAG: DUF1449 family protein [Flavobacteriaceae bacterium]|nr:DUF1449 family protein [Flavobacteriaceae bacterium]